MSSPQKTIVNPLCPVCQRQANTCDNAQGGICRLLPAPMQTHLNALYDYRVQHGGYTPPHIADYNQLPHSLAHTSFEWRIRAYDVANVLDLLKDRHQQTVLEIGAWNGWLTQHLARTGHEVTALSYSADPFDGLGAKQHYNVNWHAVQMDMSDLSTIAGKADVIIINHGLHLFTNPVDYIQSALNLLNTGGLLVALGLTFYRDPCERIQAVKRQESRCQELAGVPYMLKPGRGYMDLGDLAALEEIRFILRRYPQMWRSTIKAWIKPTAPIYRWGLYRAN